MSLSALSGFVWVGTRSFERSVSLAGEPRTPFRLALAARSLADQRRDLPGYFVLAFLICGSEIVLYFVPFQRAILNVPTTRRIPSVQSCAEWSCRSRYLAENPKKHSQGVLEAGTKSRTR